jgi:predicted small lipoprotein YifL
MTILLRVVLFVTLSLCAACGKKGPLIPPDGFAPAPVSALQVAQQGESFRISWLAPQQDLQSPGPSALAGFRLYRREVRSPNDECPTCGADDLLVRTVDLEYLQDVVRVGNLFVVVDGDLKLGKSYQYQVTAFEKSGAENRDSGRVKRKRVQPPPATTVRLKEVPAGIMLEWAPVPVESGILVGYNMYRLRPAERFAIRPFNPKPIVENRFEDMRVEAGILYRYQVRTVALVDGETVESDPSPQVEGKFVLP